MSISNSKVILAIDAGGTSIKIALVAENIITFCEVPVNSSADADSIVESFHQAIRCGLALAQEYRLEIVGVGVSTPGPFDYPNGTYLMKHKYAAMYGKSVKTIIEEYFPNKPIRFMHDSHAFLLGEIQNEKYKQVHNPCALMLGTGLGFALMKERRLLENERGGPSVSIFKKAYREATAEDYLSKRGIMSLYNEFGGNVCRTVKEIDICAKKGDALCKGVFTRTGWHVAHILAPLIGSYEIDCVIMGGQISKADDLLVDPIQKTLLTIGIDCFVTKAQTIDDAPLLGVAQSLREVF